MSRVLIKDILMGLKLKSMKSLDKFRLWKSVSFYSISKSLTHDADNTIITLIDENIITIHFVALLVFAWFIEVTMIFIINLITWAI